MKSACLVGKPTREKRTVVNQEAIIQRLRHDCPFFAFFAKYSDLRDGSKHGKTRNTGSLYLESGMKSIKGTATN